jgi:hypothetical protein
MVVPGNEGAVKMTQHTLKAIETHYKGYRFRSRLEARWAVFFDALRLQWEYEPQGFSLGACGAYLPDFRIHSWDCWVEIKPGDFSEGWSKLFAFAKTGQRLLLIRGSPWVGEHCISWVDASYYAIDGGYFYGEFSECRRCSGICLLADDDVHNHGLFGFTMIGSHTCDQQHDSWPVSGALEHAYRAARSARFEHGEVPRAYR